MIRLRCNKMRDANFLRDMHIAVLLNKFPLTGKKKKKSLQWEIGCWINRETMQGICDAERRKVPKMTLCYFLTTNTFYNGRYWFQAYMICLSGKLLRLFSPIPERKAFRLQETVLRYPAAPYYIFATLQSSYRRERATRVSSPWGARASDRRVDAMHSGGCVPQSPSARQTKNALLRT